MTRLRYPDSVPAEREVATDAYTFTRDRGRSRCYGDCARAWPPFFANGKPRAGHVYLYEHDPKREVLCNDIAEFGGTWFAMTAEGKPPS
jgi:hypothetical protein